MITHDLWANIVGYVPVCQLRLLSEASPIFDEVIYTVGIRVFYGRQVALLRHVNFESNYVIVCGLHTGKKDILLRGAGYNDHYYESLVNSNKVYIDKITWTDEPDLRDYWYLSMDGKMALTYSNDFVTFSHNVQDINHEAHRIVIKHGIDHEINYINFDSMTMVKWVNIEVTFMVEYELFKVIYSNGRFI